MTSSSVSASAEVAARTLQAFQRVDVVATGAAACRCRRWFCTARGDVAVPFDEGRRLAALIPDARFVPLESDNHVLLESEPAWPVFLSEVRAFLRRRPSSDVDDVAEKVH